MAFQRRIHATIFFVLQKIQQVEKSRRKNAYPVEDLIIMVVDESFAPKGTLLDDQ
jgi:hypothetical protein